MCVCVWWREFFCFLFFPEKWNFKLELYHKNATTSYNFNEKGHSKLSLHEYTLYEVAIWHNGQQLAWQYPRQTTKGKVRGAKVQYATQRSL